jgi:hypothetical protein
MTFRCDQSWQSGSGPMCAANVTSGADPTADVVHLETQDLHGKAEGINIVHADEQYIVPTDGKPIRGLIQVAFLVNQ